MNYSGFYASIEEACPWLKFPEEPGTKEYATWVFNWMENRFGRGKHRLYYEVRTGPRKNEPYRSFEF